MKKYDLDWVIKFKQSIGFEKTEIIEKLMRKINAEFIEKERISLLYEITSYRISRSLDIVLPIILTDLGEMIETKIYRDNENNVFVVEVYF